MKDEIKHNKKQVTVRFNLNMIIVGLLTILVFVSVVQTVTLANLIGKNKTEGKSTLPAALQQVPQQVGGC